MYWWTLQTHWLLLWLLQLVRQNYFVYPLCVICYSDKNTRAVWDGTPTARNNDTKNHSHFVLLTNEWATIISLRRKDRTTTEYIIWEVKKQEFFSSSIHCELAAKWSSHSIMSFFFFTFYNYCVYIHACGGQKSTYGSWFSPSSWDLNSGPLAWPQVPYPTELSLSILYPPAQLFSILYLFCCWYLPCVEYLENV